MSGNKVSQEILQQVQAEVVEHLGAMESCLLALDDNPRDSEQVSELFRRMHTVKGICSVFENPAMVELSHRAESFLEQARETKGELDGEALDTLFHVRDALLRMLKSEPVDVEAVLRRFPGYQSKSPETLPSEKEKIVAPPKVEDPEPEPDTFLLFQVGDCQAALHLERIREVSVSLAFRKLPFSPEPILGVSSLRGQLVTVLDLAPILKISRQRPKKGRILFIESGDELVGCWADRVLGVSTLPGWQKSSPALQHFGLELIEGVVSHKGEIVSILSVDKLFQQV